MATKELNEQMTRVGAGTPAGELLRRYWQVVGFVQELEKEPVQPVRLLGENLVLFRSERGEYGLIADRCAHRGISMAYGIPQENGLRCAYHGWTYDTEGRTVDTPFEPTCLHIKLTAYPVQEMAGLLFAYLGPQPAPLLPRYDLFVRDDLDKSVNVAMLNCNWLQCMDNSMDPVHFEHLHGTYGNYVNKKLGRPQAMNPARHLKIDFDVFEHGIVKRRLVEGDPEDSDDWTIGHPVIFPNILAQGDGGRTSFQIRVPIDDEHTLHCTYTGTERKPGAEPSKGLRINRMELTYDATGRLLGDQINRQDWLAWISQGPISDRTTEHLASSDTGILAYRKLLLQEIEKVQRGEDPMGVIRDRAKNEPMIELRRERVGYQAFRNMEGRPAYVR